ncbi:hypothetical protein D3C87_1879510 [compost metagenome]
MPLARKWLPGWRPSPRSALAISSPSSQSLGRKPSPGALCASAVWNMLRSSQVTSILRATAAPEDTGAAGAAGARSRT